MRLDVALVRLGLVESREKAKYLIKEGCVLVDGCVVSKPSKNVSLSSDISLTRDFVFVGRGGYKLASAVECFGVDFRGKVVADVGCGTGGFTDYVLRHGAVKVYAVDSGDPLHPGLRGDVRVVYMPYTDVRCLRDLGVYVDMCLIDVSFVSIKEVVSLVWGWIKHGGEVVGLVKPPYELGVGVKKVSDLGVCRSILGDVLSWVEAHGYIVKGVCDCMLEGKGSRQKEFFIYLVKV